MSTLDAVTLAGKEKTSSTEKYEEIGLTLRERKDRLTEIEKQLVQDKKDPAFDPKKKTPAFQAMEKSIKTLKEEVNALTRQWRQADPNKLHIDREEYDQHLLRRFLVVPSFEIYNGVSGLYDFGPVTCAVKANVINLWRQHFVQEEHMLELETTVLTPEPVFVASGHVQRFSDFVVRDAVRGDAYRADKLLSEFIEKKLDDPNTPTQEADALRLVLRDLESYGKDDLENKFKELRVKAPETGNDLTSPEPFNLMFDTQIGPTGKLHGYLRPETAQGLFVNFKRCLDYNGNQLPFAAATIGQAYRNEIAPRSGLLRVREFTLAEIEHFVHPDHSEHPSFDTVKDVTVRLFSRELQNEGKQPFVMTIGEAFERNIIRNQTLAYFLGRTYLFMKKCGIIEDGIRFRQHQDTEMAHYARDCWDCELLTSYGWIECVGIADRSCYDLTAHSNANPNGESLTAFEVFAEPILEDEVVIVPNKGKFGAALRSDAKLVVKHLESLSDEEKLALADKLHTEASITIDVQDSDKSESKSITLSKDIIDIKKQQKKVSGRSFTPSVIEPSFGIGRIIYCILEHSFWIRKDEAETTVTNPEPVKKGKKGKSSPQDKKLARVVLSFSPFIAPYKVAILPLSQNKEFMPFINRLVRELNSGGISNRVDLGGQAIGRKYARMDDIGIPFAITVDFDSLQNNSVTLRERDSCAQIRCSVDEICKVMNDLIEGRVTWREVQDKYPEQHQTASEKVGKK